MTRSRRKSLRPLVEGLDERCLLSGAGLTPAQVETAYGLGGLMFGTQAANGAGQTIAIVDANNDPNIQAELAMFDASNNLPPPPSLTVVGQTGTSALPTNDAGWAQEEALDVEWTHALAPGAALVLVEAYTGSIPDLVAAVQTAVGIPGVSVVSMSWSGNENYYYQPTYDNIFTAPGITFVAASGDNGFFGGVQYPASSPNVLGVGGTTLQVGSDGTYQGETPWFGTSGGLSQIEPEPRYQFPAQATGWRSTPDVAFDGNPDTGVQVYSMDPNSGQGSWLSVAGTSLGAQAWGALIAIVDQGRALDNEAALGSAQTLTALYSLPSSDFHTIGGGLNSKTGLGTPNGASLINDLVTFNASATTDSQPASTPAPTTSPVGVGKHKKGHHPKVVHHHVSVKVHPLHSKHTAPAHKPSHSA